MVGHHQSQHPRRPIEHTIGDEGLNLLRDLRQSDGGRAGARRGPKHLHDDDLGDVVDLVNLPLESMSLFKGLGQCLRIPTNRRLGRLQVLLQRTNLSAKLWKKDDKLRSKLKEKTKTSKVE